MWHARVGIFHSLKPLLKIKSENNEILSFLLYPMTYFLLSILAYFVRTQLNHLLCVINRIINPISQNLRLLKIANFLLFSVSFFSKTYSLIDGDISKILPLQFKWGYSSWCIKITLIQTYITDQNFGIVCLSQTFLNSSIQNDDHKLKIDGCNLTRSDYPSDAKKGGVCIYYKEHIPVTWRLSHFR